MSACGAACVRVRVHVARLLRAVTHSGPFTSCAITQRVVCVFGSKRYFVVLGAFPERAILRRIES